MSESNMIEGEDRINPGDMAAVKYALSVEWSDATIKSLHLQLGAYLHKDWVGRWRTCDVRIGKHIPPPWQEVPHIMEAYITNLPRMNAWEAHNAFEFIHPFQDLNGRTGRLIWLSKAVHEGYDFEIPFLQAYYYQTLTNCR